jgi:hypothetical protein
VASWWKTTVLFSSQYRQGDFGSPSVTLLRTYCESTTASATFANIMG